MVRSSLSIALLVLAPVLSTAGLAAAQSPEEGAAQEFAAGEAAFDEGDHETALAHFQHAFAGSPRPAIRFNIAICLEELGRFREAAQEYDQAAIADSLGEELVARARELGRRARAELGFVEVEGEPRGAAVMVDGERLCVLPCRLALDPGPHRLHAVADDARRSAEEAVEVSKGETLQARLVVEAAADAPAETDDSSVSPLPPTETVRRGASALTWIGLGVTVVGVAGTIGFGLYTRDLENQYAEAPTEELRDQGVTAQTLTNVSLGVAIVGALLVIIDLVFLARREVERPLSLSSEGAALHF